MEAWTEFCLAQIGASAALAGLIFVGVSINLAKVIAIPHLVTLSLEAILALATVLGQCSILLAPHQPSERVGVEILAFAVLVWLTLTVVQRRTYTRAPREHRRDYWRLFLPGQLAMLAFAAAGVLLIAGDESGLILFLPATLLCYAAALNYAWILLIEINR